MVLAQPIQQSVAALYPSLGAYSKTQVDVYATRNNVAALGQLHSSGAALYAERRFLQAQLSLYTGSIAVATQSGAFALHGTYYGYGLYNQTQLSLGYGMRVSEKIDLGVQLNYHAVHQGLFYGKANSLNASVGAIFHVTEKVRVGLNVYNPGGSKWNKVPAERMPAQYTLGLGYDVSDKLYMSGELVKEENLPTSIRAGLHYQFIQQFFARVGINTATNQGFAAVGLSLHAFRIDFSASYHPQLGLSSGVLLLFNRRKPNTTVHLAGSE